MGPIPAFVVGLHTQNAEEGRSLAVESKDEDSSPKSLPK